MTITDAPGPVMEADADRFNSRAIALGLFHRTHGRWPSQVATDPTERALGVWLTGQRLAARGKRTTIASTPERRDCLDLVAPGWQGSAERMWRKRADDLGDFYRTHRRWPSARAADENERSLSTWMRNQRSAARHDSPLIATGTARRTHLDTVAPGWQGKSLTRAWLKRATELGAFRTEHRRWPSTVAKDATERSLGQWLRNQRRVAASADPTFTADRQERLDQLCPGWEGMRRDDSWAAKAGALGAFHTEHGRWPSTVAQDQAERSLGVWLNAQRTAATQGTLAPHRRDHLGLVAAGWNTPSREVTWAANASALGAFHSEHGRWPSTVAHDPAERRLGRWLNAQRTAARGSRVTVASTPARRRHLDTVAPGWMLR